MLYLFRVLPIPIPAYFLRNLQRKTQSFIWSTLKSRISPHTLYLPKLKGGLGFPNFATYFHAAQIANIPKYHVSHEIPLWVVIETIDSDPISIPNLIWSTSSNHRIIDNKITKHTISIWERFKMTQGLQSPHVPLISFMRNSKFYPALTFPRTFTRWISAGLTQCCDFLKPASFKTFPEIRESHKLPASEIFRYLQIKNFFAPYLQGIDKLSDMTQFERICKRDPHSRGLISILYSQLSTKLTAKLPSYAEKWMNDLGFNIDISTWNKVWSNTKTSSQNILAMETNDKVLMYWYLVPVRIAKFAPHYSPLCFRGCGDPGTHLHIFWECPVTKNYWKEIFLMISAVFKKSITPDPTTALLNLKPDCISYAQFKLFLQITTAAKQTISKAWKTATLLVSETRNRVHQAMLHSKSEAITNDSIDIYETIWNPWVTYTISSNPDDSLLRPW